MKKVLSKSSIAYFLRHPWQVGLSILGIAIGVAVVISIDLANESARVAFRQSMSSVAGKATHHIVGGPRGLPDSVYFNLRNQHKFRDCAPVVESTVSILKDGAQTFTLLGIDPFAERPFRSHFNNIEFAGDNGFAQFLSQPGAIVLHQETAHKLNLSVGDPVTIKNGSEQFQTLLIGLLKDSQHNEQAALARFIISDISTAQMINNMSGYISRIDVIAEKDEDQSEIIENLQKWTDGELRIIRSDSRTQTAEQMVKSFRINLTALSLLALIVGMFLIFNTMTFSVVQRKVFIGLLRAAGVTRKEIFRLILQEALIIGIAGTIIGTGLGIFLGKGMVHLISQTINDLYFVVTVRSVTLSWFTITKGLILGIGATTLSALKPARDATRDSVSVTLKRSGQETSLKKNIPLLSLTGFVLLICAMLILLFSSKDIVLSYTGILFLILGFSLLTPLTILIFVRILNPVSKMIGGIPGRMASQSIYLHMSRTAVAIAALGLAVAATVGVGTMIGSFRSTVVKWLEQRIQADVYISAPSQVSRRNDATIPASLLTSVKKLSQVSHVNYYREMQINYDNKIINVIGVGITGKDYDTFSFKSGKPDNIWPRFNNGEGVIITEPYAFKNDLDIGDYIKLPTRKGIKRFEVLGVYYDYGTDLGLVTMAHSSFLKFWDDPRLSGISVFITENSDPEKFIRQIEGIIPENQDLVTRSNRYLREMSINIFDRTFIIANVLQFLAIIVAFIGIFSALMALQLERSRELGVLRANGLTPRQLWALTTMQTGFMGLFAGILSIPLGYVLAWVLIYIINQRSFGWTLQMEINPLIFIQAVVLAIIAALLAGIYPANKMSRTLPVEALREE